MKDVNYTEQIEKTIVRLNDAAEMCDSCTSGNFMHKIVQIKGLLKRSYEYLIKHKDDSQWIGADERLPEENEEVLFKDSNDRVYIGSREGLIWTDGNFHYTHDEDYFNNSEEDFNDLVCLWMPIPE